LRPFEVPVCTEEGEIFDFMQIIPYLRKHGNRHPFKGTDLKPSDLIRLTFHKNESGDFYCPITRKTLNENSKIVANRRSGQVYAWETVETLNISKGYWKDLVTEESFTKSDLIILQDPKNPRNFSKVFQKARDAQLNGEQFEAVSDRVNLSGGIGKVLKDLRMTEVPQLAASNEEVATLPDHLHALAPHTTGKLAASLTSTSMAVRTNSELAVLDEAETLARFFPPGKETTATACMRTNFGDLFFTLFASKSPRCTYNFIELAKRGYYDNVQFHRFVKGFILQGGDPSGSGRGGESCWKKPFGERTLHSSLNHNERGILSMANAGDVNANGSQFFITLRASPHLNGKHPIFGKLLTGDAVLEAMESEVDVDVNSGHVPLKPIVIEDVFILEDPFEEAKIEAIKAEQASKASASNKPTIPSIPKTPNTKPSPQIGKYLVMKPTSRPTIINKK
jgi:peptidyl-prolyl cis-trans isomerase-like 2